MLYRLDDVEQTRQCEALCEVTQISLPCCVKKIQTRAKLMLQLPTSLSEHNKKVDLDTCCQLVSHDCNVSATSIIKSRGEKQCEVFVTTVSTVYDSVASIYIWQNHFAAASTSSQLLLVCLASLGQVLPPKTIFVVTHVYTRATVCSRKIAAYTSHQCYCSSSRNRTMYTETC